MQRIIRSWADVPLVMGTALASELTGLSDRTVRRLCKDGHIKVRKSPGGGKYLITKSAIIDFLGCDGGPWSK